MPPSLSPLRLDNLVLNPAARVLWRGPDSVQLELGERRVIVDGIDRATVRALLRRELAPVQPSDRPRGFEPAALETLLEEGFVWLAASGEAPLDAPPAPRLGPDLGSLAARHGARAPRVLAARQQRAVAVEGHNRAAVHIGCLLAASGVGRVYFTDSGDVRLPQTMPGGLAPAAEGARFAAAAADALRAAAPEVNTSALSIEEAPDLVVLAVDEPVDSDRRDALHQRGIAHLVVRLAPGAGAVGPLVVPRLTSCLTCADLHRRDRDPDWHALAVQLTIAPHRGAPSEVALATVLGGMSALQALEFLDTGNCAAVAGTLELQLPDWRVRRRSWPVHPECDCGAVQ
jgi:hypothetical protein